MRRKRLRSHICPLIYEGRMMRDGMKGSVEQTMVGRLGIVGCDANQQRVFFEGGPAWFWAGPCLESHREE